MSKEKSTYFPSDSHQLADVAAFLQAHQDRTGEEVSPQYFLSGPGQHDHLPLPPELNNILVDAVHALNSGLAVTIHPNNLTLTTQEAAELLDVSCPTVVRLIESDRLPAQKVHRHRRLLLTGVIEYRDEYRDKQMAFIAESSDDAPSPNSAEFKRVRAQVMAQRRKKRIA